MQNRRAVPHSVHVLSTALAASAVVAAAASENNGFLAPTWVMLPLGITLVAAGMLQLEFRWGGQLEALDLFETALAPLIAVFAGPGSIAITALSKVVSQGLLRVAPVKATFNVAQWAASAGAASLVYQAASADADLHVLGLIAALAVAALVNHLAVATVLALVQRGGITDVFRGLAPVVLPGWVVSSGINICFGVLFAAVIVSRPELSVLFLVPLGLFGWAQRAYSEVVVDRTRIAALQQATHHLARDATALTSLGDALEAIRSAFSSAAVTVVMTVDEGSRTHVHAGDDSAARTAATLARTSSDVVARRVVAGDGSREAGALALDGRRCALLAPLFVGGHRIGTLVSVDRSGLDGFDGGELAIFEAVAREITGALERYGLHAALVRERARLFEIVDRSSDGIFAVTETGHVVEWNPAMAAISGFAAPADGGGRVAALLRASAGGGEVPLHDWRSIGIENLPPEIEIVTRVGESRTLACSYSETASEPVSLVVIARDVTRQRELDRLRDDFVATVSHELRTPLTSIVGFTTLLAEPPRTLTQEEHDDALRMIRKGARRLERLIFNLLEVSRIENRVTAPPGPIDIEEACENAIAEVQEFYPTREIRVRAGTGAVRALGNQLSVEQILSNLLANALKFSDHGPIDVEITETHDNLTVSVTDRGPGIPLAEQERIFERFHRMDRHNVQAGTGLGLYISRQLAVSIGATLTVRSEPNKGSTFVLTLPGELHLTAVC